MDTSARIPSSGQSVSSVGRCGHQHVVEFYETEQFLVDTVCGVVSPVLQDGDVAIVVATETHRSAFDAALRASGVDVEEAIATGRYLAFDAAELLETFMVDRAPDAGRFSDTIGGLIDRAGVGGRRVQIYGEMVAVLWDAGDVVSAIALEDMWNDLAATREFSLLCAYPMHTFEDDASATGFKRVCEQHTTVIPSEGYSLLNGADAQQRAVAGLQQELAALRADVERLGLGHQAESGQGGAPALVLSNPAREARGAESAGASGIVTTADRAAAALARQRTALDRSETANDH